MALTSHVDLLAWLGIAQEVGADALLGWVLTAHLGVPVHGTAHAQGGGLAVEGVAIAGAGDGVQAHTVGHLLALAVHLGALQMSEAHRTG